VSPNDLLLLWGLESWKPVATALLLPPVPLLVLVLAGARLLSARRLAGWALVLLGVAGLWGSCTTALGEALLRSLNHPPPALGPDDIAALRPGGPVRTAIVVLGAGRELQAPEYGTATLSRLSVERLRYGLWLSRETGLPVGFSGGVGHGAGAGPAEASIAQRIAEREFGHRLAWTEDNSRDTNENAVFTVPLAAAAGIDRLVIVTHGFHMSRALQAFERATARGGRPITIVAAPIGMGAFVAPHAEGWLPSTAGFEMTRLALHEWLGRLAGA